MVAPSSPPFRLKARTWRAVATGFLLFGGVGLVLLFLAPAIGFDRQAHLRLWLAAVAQGPWALPTAVAVFAGLAFLGVPQVALIAAAVVAFGPLRGMAYSWIGTLASSLIGFGLGRRFGGRILGELGGGAVASFMALIGRNGFLASLMVRLAPSAPFILVNMAAGVTPMRLIDFTAGTALGIVPKIALTALAGRSLTRLGAEGWAAPVIIVTAIAAWVGLGLAARAWLNRSAR